MIWVSLLIIVWCVVIVGGGALVILAVLTHGDDDRLDERQPCEVIQLAERRGSRAPRRPAA